MNNNTLSQDEYAREEAARERRWRRELLSIRKKQRQLWTHGRTDSVLVMPEEEAPAKALLRFALGAPVVKDDGRLFWYQDGIMMTASYPAQIRILHDKRGGRDTYMPVSAKAEAAVQQVFAMIDAMQMGEQ